jgi:hypothetical protein
MWFFNKNCLILGYNSSHVKYEPVESHSHDDGEQAVLQGL